MRSRTKLALVPLLAFLSSHLNNSMVRFLDKNQVSDGELLSTIYASLIAGNMRVIPVIGLLLIPVVCAFASFAITWHLMSKFPE